MPRLTFCMLLFTFSSIGLPGLNGFAGEYLILQGMFQRAWSGSPAYLGNQLLWIAVIAVFGVVLGAWYMLWLVQRLFFGAAASPSTNRMRRLDRVAGKRTPTRGKPVDMATTIMETTITDMLLTGMAMRSHCLRGPATSICVKCSRWRRWRYSSFDRADAEFLLENDSIDYRSHRRPRRAIPVGAAGNPFGKAMTTTDTIYLLLPEIVLVAMATWIYVGGAFSPIRRSWSWSALSGIGLAALALFRQPAADAGRRPGGGRQFQFSAPFLSGPLVIDGFSTVALWGILVAGLLFVLIGTQTEEDPPTAEYTGSLLLIVAGLMITAVANDLVLLFLGLELVSIPTYVVLYLGRRDAAGQESTIKYFFLSILSSALLLYGFSFLYGVAHSTDLVQLSKRMTELAPQEIAGLLPAVRLGLVLVLAGLGFRLAAVPFHFYAPDVYEGTSNANAGLLSTLPKIAGLAVLVRIPGGHARAGGVPSHLGWKLVVAISILTMTVGNLLALWQDNIRRLLAYSSIAHAGYLMIGVAVGLAVRAALGRNARRLLRRRVLPGRLRAGHDRGLCRAGLPRPSSPPTRRRRRIGGLGAFASLGRRGAGRYSCSVCRAFRRWPAFWGKFNLFLGAARSTAGIALVVYRAGRDWRLEFGDFAGLLPARGIGHVFPSCH